MIFLFVSLTALFTLLVGLYLFTTQKEQTVAMAVFGVSFLCSAVMIIHYLLKGDISMVVVSTFNSAISVVMTIISYQAQLDSKKV